MRTWFLILLLCFLIALCSLIEYAIVGIVICCLILAYRLQQWVRKIGCKRTPDDDITDHTTYEEM
jgi:hypothetical protein